MVATCAMHSMTVVRAGTRSCNSTERISRRLWSPTKSTVRIALGSVCELLLSAADYEVTKKQFAWPVKNKVTCSITRNSFVLLQCPFYFCSAADGANVVKVRVAKLTNLFNSSNTAVWRRHQSGTRVQGESLECARFAANLLN